MITQNPIIGRARKKLSGVYARTLFGKNVIQSCPTHTNIPATKALQDSRFAFGVVSRMANAVPSFLLPSLYYTAPVGRSRRHVLASQLFTGVQRVQHVVDFNLSALSELGTNPIVTTEGLLHTVTATAFSIPVANFNVTQLADTSRVPCIMAVSYALRLCVPLLDYTELDGNALFFSNLSETFLNQSVLLLPLWQTNVGTQQNPIWVYGSFQANP